MQKIVGKRGSVLILYWQYVALVPTISALTMGGDYHKGHVTVEAEPVNLEGVVRIAHKIIEQGGDIGQFWDSLDPETHDDLEGIARIIRKITDQGGNISDFLDGLDREKHKQVDPLYLEKRGTTIEKKHKHRYGFFMQVAQESLAVENVLSSVRNFYPNENIILYSDRSLDYSGMCLKYKCSFSHAGIKAGSWGDDKSGPRFLRRIVSAMEACDCDILVLLEDDVCIDRTFQQEPLGDIGGVPWPHFDTFFVNYTRDKSGVVPHKPTVWGCTGGCYFRTDTLLMAFRQMPGVLNATSPDGKELIIKMQVERSKYGDMYTVAAAMAAGRLVVPWAEAGEGGLSYDHKTGATIQGFNTSLEHKCSPQLQLRGKKASHDLACPLSEEDLNGLSENGELLPPKKLHNNCEKEA